MRILAPGRSRVAASSARAIVALLHLTFTSLAAVAAVVPVPGDDAALGIRPLVPQWRGLAVRGDGNDPRTGLTATYDALGRRLVVYGGTDALGSADAWSLRLSDRGARWERIASATPTPTQRRGHAAALDTRRNRLVVYGGNSAGEPLGPDAWVLQLGRSPRWERMIPAGPTPPSAGAMYYDPGRDRMLMVPDWLRVPGPAEVWELSFAGSAPTWRKLAAVYAPPSVTGGAFAQDVAGRRLLLFGGRPQGADFSGPARDQLFEIRYDVPGRDVQWAYVEPALDQPRPPGTSHGAAAWDAVGGRLWIHGGQGNDETPQSDLWAARITYPGCTWEATRFDPLQQPSWRLNHTLTFEPRGGRLVLLGGDLGSIYTDEVVWAADLYRMPAPSVSEWQDEEGSADDPAAAPAGDPGDETGAGAGRRPVRVDTGLRAPNVRVLAAGAGRAVEFEVGLWSAEPARLTLFDVGGRHVVARDVGALGVGSHRVALEGTASLPAGLYFVRLAQGTAMVTVKFVRVP